jgi:hypothetical protein
LQMVFKSGETCLPVTIKTVAKCYRKVGRKEQCCESNLVCPDRTEIMTYSILKVLLAVS